MIIEITHLLEKYHMKYFFYALFFTLITGCSQNFSRQISYFENAYLAINRQDWEVAYRFIEDKFVSQNEFERERAFSIIKSYPEIIEAGIKTFNPENIKNTINSYGESRGIDLERKRLNMLKEIVSIEIYINAKSNIDKQAVEMDENRERLLKESIEKQEASLEILRTEKKAQELIRRELREAKDNAYYLCQNKKECDKYFSLTQIFISENSTMKIQVATDTVLETFSATTDYGISIKAYKIPKKGDTALIKLSVDCRIAESTKGETEVEIRKEVEIKNSYCNTKTLKIYNDFKKYIPNNIE